jgi:hypothetical protein
MGHRVTLRRWPLLIGATLVVSTLFVSDSYAVRHQPREGWVAGISWGLGKGAVTTPEGREGEFHEGAAPQWRVGHTLGSRLLLAFEHRAWFVELGSVPAEEKLRLTLQSYGFSLDFFPGKSANATGGIYLRAGAGLGWSGVGQIEGLGLGETQRTDEFGFSGLIGAGYDFWVARDFMLGAGTAYNYFSIGGDEYVDTGWFTPVVLNGSLFF